MLRVVLMKNIVVAVVLAGLSLSIAGCATGESSNSPDASSLVGTWVGSNIGYENGKWQEREARYVIEEGTGDVFVGLKFWREIGGEWSEAEIFSGSLHDSGEFFASDLDGFILGTVVSESRISATYLEAGPDQGAFALALEKEGR